MKAIPKFQDELPYVVVDDLPDYQQAPLNKWLVGQTRPLIESERPKSCCYYWDYDVWYDAWLKGREAINLD